MEGIVNFYKDQPGWYHAYNDDAIVVSNILGYKLFERSGNKNAIGFPEKYFRKVTVNLRDYNIGYNIDGIIIDYPNSKYNQCLKNEFTKYESYTSKKSNISKKDIISGNFTIQFNEEEPIELEIGVNINSEAPIVKFVSKNAIDCYYEYGDDIVKIISKDISIN